MTARDCKGETNDVGLTGAPIAIEYSPQHAGRRRCVDVRCWLESNSYSERRLARATSGRTSASAVGTAVLAL